MYKCYQYKENNQIIWRAFSYYFLSFSMWISQIDLKFSILCFHFKDLCPIFFHVILHIGYFLISLNFLWRHDFRRCLLSIVWFCHAHCDTSFLLVLWVFPIVGRTLWYAFLFTGLGLPHSWAPWIFLPEHHLRANFKPWHQFFLPNSLQKGSINSPCKQWYSRIPESL